MPTKLFLRNISTSGISDTGDGTLFDLSTTAGSSVDTTVTNTTAGGTEIQATKTAGGSTVAWISGRAPAGGFTLTNTDISLWQIESHMNANIGGRYRVFKRTAAGVITEVGGGPFNDGVEMNTTDREDLWPGNVTDTAFAEDDRILLRYYITNAGTMAAGHTGTMQFNAADGATGDSFFNIAETVTFKPNAQTIAPSAIASTEAFGTAKLNRTVSPSGIASAATIGAPVLGAQLGIGDGLVSFWKLDEATGATRNDSVGSNHLTDIGAGVVKLSPGKVGDGARFSEGTGAYLSVSDNAALSITGNLSIMAWVRIDAAMTESFPGIAGKWAHTDQRSYTLRYDRGTDRFIFQVSPDGTGAAAIGVAADIFGAVPEGTWCLAQAYVDLAADVIAIRVNDGAWNTASYTASGIFDGSAAFEIGRLGTSGAVLHGDIDSVGIWSRRLSDANWASLWNNGDGIEVVSPVAKAGLDQTRMELETVFLDGSHSVGDGLTYSWSQISGTSVTLTNPTSVNPQFTAPDVSTPETLVFELTVTETDLDTDSDQVSIRIVPTGSNEWLHHTPLEADIDANTFYSAFDSMPSPCMVLRNGRVIGAKGDVTLEGFTWSASKMLTAMIAARQIHLNNIELTDTIPGSDFPSSPTATLFQFLNMTSDYGLNQPSHSPGDHFAYNNGGTSFLGDYLNTTFYNGQTEAQMLLSAFGTALNYEDTLSYAGTPSGWDGGWSKSTRDLARDAQLVLQGGVWNGTQILDADFCNTGLWQEQIPEAATASTDEDDEFYNQAGTTAIIKDGWSLGWWYLHPGVAVPVVCIAMQGKFGTTVYINREQNLIAVACNVGGAVDDSAQTRIASIHFAAIVDAVATPANQFITSVGGIASAQAVSTAAVSASVRPTSIASSEAHGATTVTQSSSSIVATGIASAEAFDDPVLSLTVAPPSIASSEAMGVLAVSRTVSTPAITSTEAFGTTTLSRTVTTAAIASAEAVGLATVSIGSVTLGVSAIASTETFGSHTLQPGSVTLTPPSIETGEAVGSATVSSGALILFPPSIDSDEVVGTASLARTVSITGVTTAEAHGSALLSRTVSLSAITSTEALGSPVVSSGALFVVPSSINSAEDFGSTTLSPGAVTITPSSIESLEMFGSMALLFVVASGSITSSEVFGSTALSHSVATTGIVTTEAFGSVNIQTGAVVVGPSGLPSNEVFGSAGITTTGTLSVFGITSGEAFGAAALSRTLTPGAIASSAAFGSLLLTVPISPSSITSTEALGDLTAQPSSVSIVLAAIDSGEVFGSPSLLLNLLPFGISTSEALGSLSLLHNVSLSGIASTESVGDLIVQSGAFFLLPSAIAPLEAFGVSAVGRGSVTITVSAIDSVQAMGAVQVSGGISLSGIVSSESFGSALVHAYGPGGAPHSTGRSSNSQRFATASVSSKTDVSVRRGR